MNGGFKLAMIKSILLSIFCIVGTSVAALPQNIVVPNESRLFAAYDTLNLRVEAPFAELFKTKPQLGNQKNSVDGAVIVDGRAIPVTIRRQGWSSLHMCKFPKLMFKFKKRDVAGTIFEGNTKLDVGTHCGADGQSKDVFAAMRFNHRESMIYRWMQILEIPGYSSRPARLVYIDTVPGGFGQIEEDAFLLEHLSSLKKRAGAIEIRHKDDRRKATDEEDDGIEYVYSDYPDHPQIDVLHLARIALLENMIGNGDWRLNSREIWNLKILQLPSGTWLPVPMDFNFAYITTGQAVNFGMTSPFFDSAPKADRLRLLEEFEARRGQLEESIKALDADPVGQAAFRETLRAQFEQIAREKIRLGQQQP